MPFALTVTEGTLRTDHPHELSCNTQPRDNIEVNLPLHVRSGDAREMVRRTWSGRAVTRAEG